MRIGDTLPDGFEEELKPWVAQPLDQAVEAVITAGGRWRGRSASIELVEVIEVDVGPGVADGGGDGGPDGPTGPHPGQGAIGVPRTRSIGEDQGHVDDEAVDFVGIVGQIAARQLGEVVPHQASQPVAELVEERQHHGPIGRHGGHVGHERRSGGIGGVARWGFIGRCAHAPIIDGGWDNYVRVIRAGPVTSGFETTARSCRAERGRAPMADGLHRLLNLYGLLLAAHREAPLTLTGAREALADQYDDYDGESGRKAFRRDRQHLLAAGVPIRERPDTDIRGAPGWWIPRDEYLFSGLGLTDLERAALRRAIRVVDFRDVLWVPIAAAKLTDPKWDAPFEAGTTETVAVFVAPPALPALQEARARRALVRFRYRGRDRVLESHGLGTARGHWYVVGPERPVEAGAAVKVFRVDRIDGAVTVVAGDGAFEVPDDFDVRAHIPADKWAWGDSAFEVRVAADREVAGILAADAGDGLETSIRADGRVELRFLCAQRDVFLSWALGLGDRVEVLGPPDLRADVVQRLQAFIGSTADAT